MDERHVGFEPDLHSGCCAELIENVVLQRVSSVRGFPPRVFSHGVVLLNDIDDKIAITFITGLDVCVEHRHEPPEIVKTGNAVEIHFRYRHPVDPITELNDLIVPAFDLMVQCILKGIRVRRNRSFQSFQDAFPF